MRRPTELLLLGCFAVGGCPSGRDSGNNAPTEPSKSAQPSTTKAASGTDPIATPSTDEPRIVALVSGEPLADEPAETGDAFGVELRFEVRPLAIAQPAVGAVPSALSSLQSGSAGTLQVELAAGRARMRVGARTFALEDGDTLIGDRRRAGLVFTHGPAYRVVPPGALRTLLADRRLDVVPLASARTMSGGEVSVAGRTASRVTVTTSYGSLQLDQLRIEPPKQPPVASKDAGAEAGPAAKIPAGLDGAGEVLCRALLELVASELTLGGAPCAADRVPLRAEVIFARGGGLLVEPMSVREGPVSRGPLAFPPAGSKHTSEPLGEVAGWVALDLLPLRAKGDPSLLELSAPPGLPRIAMIDGVPLLTTGSRSLPLRAGRYAFEWRSPLFEQTEAATELVVPGKAHASIGPWPVGSSAPMASARSGP